MCKLIFEVVTFIACARTQSVCRRLVAFLLHKQTLQAVKLLHADRPGKDGGRGGDEKGVTAARQSDMNYNCLLFDVSSATQIDSKFLLQFYMHTV